MKRNQVLGIAYGTAIGDALGMPFETMSAEQIGTKVGRVNRYHRPDGHKWFDGRSAGTVTDDTISMLAILESLTVAHHFDLEHMARTHVRRYQHSAGKGWGKTTKVALGRLANGVSFRESGIPDDVARGTGNGVAMKIAILAPFFYGLYRNIMLPSQFAAGIETRRDLVKTLQLAFMTHATPLGASQALAQVSAAWYCLSFPKPDQFNGTSFRRDVANYARLSEDIGEYLLLDRGFPLYLLHDNLSARIAQISMRKLKPDQIIALFGAGSCYANHSLPFSYAFFLRNPFSIETLYDVVSAGGDTDSNGAIVGALLGALNGASIFPDHLVQGLDPAVRAEIDELVDRFCELYNIYDDELDEL